MAVKQNRDNRTPTTSEDLDWVDITVDINDGWADDVSLVYPEDSWKPDNEELTKLDMPELKKKKSKNTKKKKSPAAYKEVPADPTLQKREKKKTHPFRIFMIIWLGTLSIAIAIGLHYFYNFVENYEKVYQESRPYHRMDDILAVFESEDMDSIYQMIDIQPEITEFETTENVKHYIAELLNDVTFKYVATANYIEDLPEYYITANDYIVATVALRKNPTEYLSYGFPIWYISSFDFYTEAQHSCKIQAPNNCTVYINGVPVSDDYVYQRAIRLEDRAYVQDYAILPTYVKYECTGFYETPVITATNCFGQSAPVTLNTSTGMYEVGFGEPDENTKNSMQSLALQMAEDYANCISHDIALADIEHYFLPESTILEMLRSGATNNYFANHTTPVIQNKTIKRFTAYSNNIFMCEVSLDQCMNVYGREEVVNTDLTYYFVLTEDGYKCCNIVY